MWKKIKDIPYYIDVTIDKHYEVFVTDFVKIWSALFSQEEFREALLNSEYNIGLEIDDEELVDKGVKILLCPDKLCYASCDERNLPYGSFLIVSLALEVGIELCLDMNLVLQSRELFFLKVAQPLLNIVKDLKQSENELRQLLAKKDEEITEYKTQGGKIKYTALPPYNDTEHMNKHSCYNNFFDSIQDPENVLNKTVDNCTRRPGMQHDQNPDQNTSIKVEPSSETVSSSQANNVIPKEEPGVSSIKAEPSSKSSLNHAVTTATITSQEPINGISVKVEPSSENVDSREASSITMTEVKNEFKSFRPKKKRLNI